MISLHCGPLQLEPLCADHAEEMWPIISDSALYEHLDYPPPPSVEYLRQAYAKLESRQSPDGTERWLNWIIREPAGHAAGFVQSTILSGSRAWVAYMVGRTFWGNGYGALATGAMIRYLVADLGVRRLLAMVEVANSPSQSVLRRLQFHLAGPDEVAALGLSPEPTERLFTMTIKNAP